MTSSVKVESTGLTNNLLSDFLSIQVYKFTRISVGLLPQSFKSFINFLNLEYKDGILINDNNFSKIEVLILGIFLMI